MRAHQRSNRAADCGAALKLHLHLVEVGATTFHVLTPRPGTKIRFSTNYFHQTHHILSDMAGARFLGRLLWGLAFQKQPNTLIWLGGEFLAPTPFDAETSDPICLLPAHLTPLDAKKLAVLRAKMRGSKSARTVRWQTWGLDEMQNFGGDWWEHPLYESWGRHAETQAWRDSEVMRRVGKTLCYSAMPLPLKVAALAAFRLQPDKYVHQFGMDYCEIASRWKRHSRGWNLDGEIQVFTAYHQMLRDAALARREIEEERGAVATLERDRLRVQHRARKISRRREAARKS